MSDLATLKQKVADLAAQNAQLHRDLLEAHTAFCSAVMDLAAERERRAASPCPDGCHRSDRDGYGHQRCVECGLEWDFYPPRVTPEQE